MNAKTLLFAALLSAATVTPAWSGFAVPPPSGGGIGPGPGIVAGSIVSVLSVMICAQWSCQTSNREMTSEEALLAATLPLSCLWLPRNPKAPKGPVCSGPPH